MGPHIRLTAAILVPVIGLGCAASRREVRLEADIGPVTAYLPESGGQRIELSEAELWGAFREAGWQVVAQVDPLAAAEQAFGLAERSGTYLYFARTGRLVPESRGDGLAEPEAFAELVTRGYLEWCGGTRLGPGDCLRLLTRSKTLSSHGRYVVALVMAMASSFGPMLDNLGELANPNAVAVTLASAATMYLLLLVMPEPISKIIATGLTVTLIGYLGLDLFWSLVNGWKALVSAVDVAKDFGQVRLAAREFGQVLGPRVGQILVLLVSRSLGKGLAAKGPALPRFSEASAQARKLLRVHLAAATAVRTVTLGAGAITISLASSAMVVTSPASTSSRPGSIKESTTPKPGVRFHPDRLGDHSSATALPWAQHQRSNTSRWRLASSRGHVAGVYWSEFGQIVTSFDSIQGQSPSASFTRRNHSNLLQARAGGSRSSHEPGLLQCPVARRTSALSAGLLRSMNPPTTCTGAPVSESAPAAESSLGTTTRRAPMQSSGLLGSKEA